MAVLPPDALFRVEWLVEEGCVVQLGGKSRLEIAHVHGKVGFVQQP